MRISDWSSDVCSSDLTRTQEAVRRRSDRRDRIIVKAARIAEPLPLQPVMVKFDPHHVEPVKAEGMDITMADARPVDELDPQLVGRVGFADELVLVDAEHRVEQADRSEEQTSELQSLM